jgi:restriction endonuclease S subunit
MKLKQLCTVQTNLPNADFYIVRSGSQHTIGRVTKEYNKDYIGIKVTRTDILVPDYLYYLLMNLYNRKYFKSISNGTTLQHITTQDVGNISFLTTGELNFLSDS